MDLHYKYMTPEALRAEYVCLAYALDAAHNADEKWAIREQRQEIRDAAKFQGIKLG